MRRHLSNHRKKDLQAYLPEPSYCNGKRSYDKKGAVTVKNDRYRKERVELRVYECDVGTHWHVTSHV